MLLVSLYRWLPERDQLKALKFTTTNKTEEKERDDYIYIDNDNIYLLLNKDKKKHGESHINLSEEFQELTDMVLKFKFW